MFEVSVSYLMKHFPHLDSKLDTVACQHSGSSGAGFGFRDHQYDYLSYEEAVAAARRLKAVDEVETVTLFTAEGVEMPIPN